jgi:hypothetical protein
MFRRLTISFAVAALASAPALAAGQEAGAVSRCYGEWSEAAPIVAREKLRSALDVQDMAREQLGGDVVRIVLCEGDEGFVYRLVLRRLDGHIGTATVTAARKRDR